jgi:hypothetical protein
LAELSFGSIIIKSGSMLLGESGSGFYDKKLKKIPGGKIDFC